MKSYMEQIHMQKISWKGGGGQLVSNITYSHHVQGLQFVANPEKSLFIIIHTSLAPEIKEKLGYLKENLETKFHGMLPAFHSFFLLKHFLCYD